MLSLWATLGLMVITLIFAAVIIIFFVIISSEKKTVFCPDLDPEWVDPESAGVAKDEIEDVSVTTEDGVKLHGWFYRTLLQRLIVSIQEKEEKKAEAEDEKKKKKKNKKSAPAAAAAAAAEAEAKHAVAPLGSPTVLYLHGNSGSL